MNSKRIAALGCRAHSGWAAIVVIAGTPDAPEVVSRRRIENADAGIKQPYHAAEPLPFEEAKALIRTCTEGTRQLTRKAIRGLLDDMLEKGYKIAGCGVALGSGRTLPELKSILASHALLHTAEGEFYRHALVDAGEH